MDPLEDAKITRRMALKLAGAAAVAGALSRLAHGESSTKPRVAWQSSAQTASYLYARTSGALKNAGVDVEHIKFSAGPPIFAALRSDSVDLAFFAETPASIMLAQGIPAKVISVAADYGGAMGLVTGKESNIRTVSDLRGKKIAVVRGSAAHYTLGAILRENRMSLNDVELISVDVTNLIPAFQNRNVDAALYWEPWMSRLVQSGGRVLMTNWQAKQPSATMWVARTKWLEQNEATAIAFVKGLDAVNGDIRREPAKVAAVIAEELGLDVASLTQVLTTESRFPTLREMLDPSYVYSIAPQSVAAGKGLAGVLKEVAVFMKDIGTIDRVPDVTQGFAPGIAQQALQSKV